MRTIAIAGLIALLPAGAALAQSKSASKPQPDRFPKAQPDKRAKACAEYGAGFVRIEGSGTCVKIGGYVRFQRTTR